MVATLANLYHIPTFRSTRVLWTIAELARLYPPTSSSSFSSNNDDNNINGNTLPNIIVHEFTDIPKFRESKPDWYLDLNPNGKIPTWIQTSASASSPPLFEGGAIMLSLLDQYDVEKKLLPDEHRDLFYQLAFYCTGTIDNISASSSPIQRAVMLNKDKEERANLQPTIDPIRRSAWKDVAAPFLESVLNRSNKNNDDGIYFSGNDFSAIDIVVGMCLFAFHERMIARGDGKSWIDPITMPKLWALSQSLVDRPARKFALETTLSDPKTLANIQDFGIHQWIEASEPHTM